MEFLEGENSPSMLDQQPHPERSPEYPPPNLMHTESVRLAKDLGLVRPSSYPQRWSFTMNGDESSLHDGVNSSLAPSAKSFSFFLPSEGAALKDAGFSDHMEARGTL